MKFKTWLETQDDRRARWLRRKSQQDGKTSKQGQVAGNVRYNGKSGYGSTQQPNRFRTKDQGNDDQLR